MKSHGGSEGGMGMDVDTWRRSEEKRVINSSSSLSFAAALNGEISPTLQGSAKRWAPGCVNAAGKAKQKW